MFYRKWLSIAMSVTICSLLFTSPDAALAETAAQTGAEQADQTQKSSWRGPGLLLASAAFLVSGAGWHWQASQDFARYDREYTALCPDDCGFPDNDLAERLDEIRVIRDRADQRRTRAYISYIATVGLAGTGLFFLSHDRVKPRLPRLRGKSLLVLGVGLAAIATAGSLQWSASDNFADYDRQVADACSLGCAPADIPDLENRRKRAGLQRDLAFVGYAVGATAALTGVLLGYTDKSDDDSDKRLSVVPSMTPANVGMTLKGSF